MAREPRDESPGYHHVVTRGNNKRVIYADDRDRQLFCLTATRIARKYDWSILAYVLMRNHYHLLIRVGAKGLSAGMRDLNHAHAMVFNARHARINHLFGKRFWNRTLRTEASLRNAARYIVQNPWRAGGTADLAAYEWSSYAATAGRSFSRMAIDANDLLQFFGPTPHAAQDAYRAFCRERPEPTELDEPCPVPGTVT